LPARSTGNPGFFREFFLEKFITVNAQENFQPEGPGGGKGEPGVPPNFCVYRLFYGIVWSFYFF
jgi:hypothetical protein